MTSGPEFDYGGDGRGGQMTRPRREDRQVSCFDLDRNSEQVSFLASDVVDYGIGSYTESGYDLSYRHHLELHPLDTGLSHPTLMLLLLEGLSTN